MNPRPCPGQLWKCVITDQIYEIDRKVCPTDFLGTPPEAIINGSECGWKYKDTKDYLSWDWEDRFFSDKDFIFIGPLNSQIKCRLELIDE